MNFLLFAFDQYYPGGGWEDFKSAHETLEDATAAAALHDRDWKHVVEVGVGIVWSS